MECKKEETLGHELYPRIIECLYGNNDLANEMMREADPLKVAKLAHLMTTAITLKNNLKYDQCLIYLTHSLQLTKDALIYKEIG